MKALLPLLVLAFLSPFFTELQSGNIPFPNFFVPGVFIFLLTVGYGFAAIVIREVSVRYHMGLLSTLLLGMAYGLYNEGLIARTLIRDHSMPVSAFNGEQLVLGLNVGFTLILILVHALQAVVYPIFATQLIFPNVRSTPWISRKMTGILLVVLLMFGTGAFFRTDEFGTGTIEVYLLLLILMGAFVFAAFRLKERYQLTSGGIWTKKTILLGATAVIPFITVSIIAGSTDGILAQASTFFITLFLLFKFVWMRHLRSEVSWIAFGIGHMFTGMLIGGTTLIIGSPNAAPALIGYAIVTVFLFFFMRKFLYPRPAIS